MLNYLWITMNIAGVVYGAFTGNIARVSDAFLEGGKEAVSLAITMLGVISLWTGIMNIAIKSGLITSMRKRMSPLIKFLFPDIPVEHRAAEYIAINMISNIFGLGWAATPAGLKAMEEMSHLESEKRGTQCKVASNSMCSFLIINISSLQLIPINIIAYRAEYGSANPAQIIVPALIATFFSTLVAVIFCKIMCRLSRNY